MPRGDDILTIIAESTPPGQGGISVIRTSGPDSLYYLSKIAKTKSTSFVPRRVYHKKLWDENNNLIDSGLITFFKGPSSYTGEDAGEISCHGSPFVVEKVLSYLVSIGATIAPPGEYTKRAFLNGKLNLMQAEAVGEIISARTKRAVSLNLKILNENDAGVLRKTKQDIVFEASKVEHALDISDEDLSDEFISGLINSITYTSEKLKTYLENYEHNQKYLRPQVVVLFGKPNVGKSTLFNALLEKDRAITSATPGTTRDTIEHETFIGGVCVQLVDTAGTRETSEHVEAEGVRRTAEAVLKSDLILHVVEGVDNIELEGQRITVYNKNDVIKYKKQTTGQDTPSVYISAKNGAGLKALKEKIYTSLVGGKEPASSSVITTARQLQALKNSQASLKTALDIMSSAAPEIELVAFELRASINALSDLLGSTNTENILESVFENFCVGK